MATKLVRTGLVEANGTQLYHEIRGDGPPVVFIAGGVGYAGGFADAAELLADTYTVLTYDRRGASRSPKPDGWTTTSVQEQADDCAALIEALGLERPAVLGHSFGGTVLVGLLERHAHVLRGAIVYEPMLPSVSPSYADFATRAAQTFADGLAAGSLEETWDRFCRWMFGDTAWESLPTDERAQALESAEVNTEIVSPAFLCFEPNAQALSSAGIPIHAVYGAETANTAIACVIEAATWVSEASGGALHALPGDHLAITTRRDDVVQALRPILESMA